MIDYASILGKAVTVSGNGALSRLGRERVYKHSARTLASMFRKLHPEAPNEELEREMRRFSQAVQSVERTLVMPTEQPRR